MKLKVGELARRAGLTVRTLHHYDAIGLLQPSARSDAGYRLYDEGDIARLHGIQALQGLGLALEQIGRALGPGSAELPAIIDRQLQALERQMAQTAQLKQQLLMLQRKFVAGDTPASEDWLDTLSLMTTMSRHFDADETARLFEGWLSVRPAWKRLVVEVEAERRAGTPTFHERVQTLAQRWMSLMHDWMGGDYALMERWGAMYIAEPGLQGEAGVRREIVDFIDTAVQQRLAHLRRHLSEADLRALRGVPYAEWEALALEVQPLLEAGVPPSSPPAAAAARCWQALMRRFTGEDPALLARVMHAYEQEPLLRAGALLGASVRDYLGRAAAACCAAGTDDT
jgi:DNA-binding transcriptional MerR regulator